MAAERNTFFKGGCHQRHKPSIRPSEQFRSQPNGGTLTALVAEAGRQQQRPRELEAALQFCSEHPPKYPSQDLITQILLLAGRFTEAFIRGKDAKPVGWSECNAGLLYFSALYLLSEGQADCSLIADGLRYYSTQHDFFFESFHGQPDDSASCRELITGLRQIQLSEEEQGLCLTWCMRVADKRVREIVINKHRNA